MSEEHIIYFLGPELIGSFILKPGVQFNLMINNDGIEKGE